MTWSRKLIMHPGCGCTHALQQLVCIVCMVCKESLVCTSKLLSLSPAPCLVSPPSMALCWHWINGVRAVPWIECLRDGQSKKAPSMALTQTCYWMEHFHMVEYILIANGQKIWILLIHKRISDSRMYNVHGLGSFSAEIGIFAHKIFQGFIVWGENHWLNCTLAAWSCWQGSVSCKSATNKCPWLTLAQCRRPSLSEIEL